MRVMHRQAGFIYSDGQVFLDGLVRKVKSIYRVSGPYSEFEIDFSVSGAIYRLGGKYEVSSGSLVYGVDSEVKLSELFRAYGGRELELGYCLIRVEG